MEIDYNKNYSVDELESFGYKNLKLLANNSKSYFTLNNLYYMTGNDYLMYDCVFNPLFNYNKDLDYFIQQNNKNMPYLKEMLAKRIGKTKALETEAILKTISSKQISLLEACSNFNCFHKTLLTFDLPEAALINIIKNIDLHDLKNISNRKDITKECLEKILLRVDNTTYSKLEKAEFKQELRKKIENFKSSKLTNVLKDDFIEASYKTASEQIIKLVFDFIVNYAEKSNKENIKKVLLTEQGKYILAFIAGVILDQSDNAHAKKIGQAFRIQAMSKIGNEMMDAVTNEVKLFKDISKDISKMKIRVPALEDLGIDEDVFDIKTIFNETLKV
ncbi:MAG: hypothetical protein LC122_02640 [Chitinophagales bacterium]|nr:hypothetical protein [Chitinophagales bacterium]